MTEYTKFIERRKRMQAFQFRSPGQAGEVAFEFNSDSYELRFNDGAFHLDIITPDGTQRVNKGDFVVRDGWLGKPQIIARDEFIQAWERE